MTEPIDDEDQAVGPILTPDDLKAFATIAEPKAKAMIEDAIGTAFIHAPCILADDFDPQKRAAAKAILRGAVLRWNEAGNGAVTTQTTMSYGQTVDTRQPRKVMFFPSELDALRRLCRPADDTGGAFSIDTLPVRDGIVHAEICSIYFGGGCSCGALLTQGLPLYERDHGWG
ncbi:head-tail adaptor [Mycobacterium phage Jolie2]|uniref:Head-to-tail adaptor n=1 Tax=Mycobacterium phage Jolie2 TaxID=1458831 RepID=W8E9C9_9CAUD|nr:head-tail adaptor [Mycobacterium phage Jolie2]AHJ86559.1 hypothetical protein Jolie2_9 [Mycobacterium phage Jolie2]